MSALRSDAAAWLGGLLVRNNPEKEGVRARLWRESMGFSRRELSEKTGYAERTIAAFEAGEYAPGKPVEERSMRTYRLACASVALGVDFSWDEATLRLNNASVKIPGGSGSYSNRYDDSLESIADRAIELHNSIIEKNNSIVKSLSEMLLLQIGRALSHNQISSENIQPHSDTFVEAKEGNRFSNKRILENSNLEWSELSNTDKLSPSAIAETLDNVGNIQWTATGKWILDLRAAKILLKDFTDADKPIDLNQALSFVERRDLSSLLSCIKNVRKNGGPIFTEFRLKSIYGDIRWALMRGRVTRDNNLQYSGAQMIVIDITDIKISEK